jgi:hypothetical protein
VEAAPVEAGSDKPELLKDEHRAQAKAVKKVTIGETGETPLPKASVKKRKTNSHLGIATAKTTQDEWRELCKLSGEKVPIDALVMYHEYHDKGDERFLTDYTVRVQQLVTAYKEGRIQEFLSETQASKEKTAG